MSSGHWNSLTADPGERTLSGVPQNDAGMTDAGKGPLAHLRAGLASLRDFSPFAFACPVLEQQYQDYQGAHVASHVGTMCWLLGLLWVAVITLTWHRSIIYPGAWLVKFPLALCMLVGFFGSYAPVRFRKHWQACSFAINVAHVLMIDTFHSFVAAFHAPTGGLHYGIVVDMVSKRLPMSLFFAMGAPLSLPLYLLAQLILFGTQKVNLAGKMSRVQGSECVSIPWPVSSALHDLALAYLGVGAHVPESIWCRVSLVFWKVQTEMMGAMFGVLRDVAWRRAFLNSHPHLIGHNGAARAAAWPFGSPRTVVTCFGLALSVIFVDVLAIHFWVWAIVRGA